MLFAKHILEDNTKIGIWKIEETEEDLRNEFSVSYLSDKQFQQINYQKRKLEWLSVRALLKAICQEEKSITYNSDGKPSLADNSCKISISHTDKYAAIILHPTKDVGIDIERMSDRVLKIKERFLSTDELLSLSEKETTTQALLYWSAKETLFKIIPEAEIDFIEHLHINPFQLEQDGVFAATETKTQQKQTYQINYKVFQDFVLTFTTK